MTAGPFMAYLYWLVIDPIWDFEDPDAKTKAMAALDWPDDAQARQAEMSDRQARAAMARLGLDPNQIMAGLEARRQAAAAAEATALD